jgi:hypothetical protein
VAVLAPQNGTFARKVAVSGPQTHLIFQISIVSGP